MADSEVGGPSLAHIDAPAATDRVPMSTGSASGGYSRRNEFVYRDAAGVFQAEGAIRGRYTPGDGRAKLIVSNAVDGTAVAPAYSEIQLRGGSTEFDVATISAYNAFVNLSETALLFSLRNSANGFGERMRLTGNGRLGIGNANPQSPLHVAGELTVGVATEPNSYNLTIQPRAPEAGTMNYDFKTVDATYGARTAMTITAMSRVGLGTIAPQCRLHISDVDQSVARLRIQNTGSGGRAFDLVAGIPGVTQADFSLFDATNAGNLMVWGVNYVRPGGDNSQSAGTSSFRYSVVHAVTGTINTCDIRLKFYRAEPAPTPDEHGAVLECFEAFGFFQHLDAVARETDGGAPARWHFGPKAQEVWAIFANNGLAAPLGEDGLPPEGSVPPAFLCFDAWGEETAPVMTWWKPSAILGPDDSPIMVPCAEGEEGTEQRPTGETYVVREAGNIFGIRIDQLQSLMLVALNKERIAQASTIAAQEARLAALEALA